MSHRNALYSIFLIFIVTSPCLARFSFGATILTLTVNTDKYSYLLGEVVKIYGTVRDSNGNPIGNATISIEVRNPSNNTIFLDILYSSSEGTYKDSFRLHTDDFVGKYSVFVTAYKVRYSIALNKTSFYVTGTTTPVTQRFTLKVRSRPVKGVPIEYSGDFAGTETTDFTIGSENSPFTVTLNAPLTYQGYEFDRWELDGVEIHRSSLTVSVDEVHNIRTALAVYVPETLDSIASQYAKSGEAYKIFNVKIGNYPYHVALYYPSSETNPKIQDFTGAVVINATDLEPIVATENPYRNLVVNGSITLALAKWRGWVTKDPSFWSDLHFHAKAGYVSLLVMYGGVQALWITIEFATGGVFMSDIAIRAAEIASFALEQTETLERIGGVADAIHDSVSLVSFGKDMYEGLDALNNVYLAYTAEKWLTSEDLIEYHNQLAYTKTKATLLAAAETIVDYAFTDDIGGMATTMLEVGEYTKILEGISKHISTIVHAIIDDTVTPPQIYSLLDSQVAYAVFALRTWSAMENMYRNIVNKGVFNVWYWLMDAQNSLKHYQQVYNSWLSVLEDSLNQRNNFYNAIDRLYQQSVERVIKGTSPSDLNASTNENISTALVILVYIFCVFNRKYVAMAKKTKGGQCN